MCDGWKMVYLVVEDVHEARRLKVEDDALRVPVGVLKRLVTIGAGRVYFVDALRARASPREELTRGVDIRRDVLLPGERRVAVDAVAVLDEHRDDNARHAHVWLARIAIGVRAVELVDSRELVRMVERQAASRALARRIEPLLDGK